MKSFPGTVFVSNTFHSSHLKLIRRDNKLKHTLITDKYDVTVDNKLKHTLITDKYHVTVDGHIELNTKNLLNRNKYIITNRRF
jgi:flagellar biosynthesis/type III secretory pathway ATPase